MAAAKRFALSPGGEYRLALWFGRALALFGLWPTYYAFRGMVGIDWEAILFGAPTLVGGLLLWRWAGYRLRNPRDYLEVDREAGVARLVRRETEPTVCNLDELGDWRFESWTTSRVNKGATITTTFHGVACAGFDGDRLFVSEDAGACRRWSAGVDALARPFDASGWTFADADVEAVMVRHGLRDRDALLWTATGFVGPGAHELARATLTAAARSLTETTLAVRIAERLDDVQSKVGSMAFAGMIGGTALFASLASRALLSTDGESPVEAAILLALALGAMALGWRAVKGPGIAGVVAALAGAAFVGKPWYAPIVREYEGSFHAMSPTSETHLYYVLPGVGLLVLGIGLASTIKVRKPATAIMTTTTTRGEAVTLEPPRPEPPQPPGK